MIQLSIENPPGRIRFALGSNPVHPRHQLRRRSAGSERTVCCQNQRVALAFPATTARSANSASSSAATSSRSASGIRPSIIAIAIRGGRGVRLRASRASRRLTGEYQFAACLYNVEMGGAALGRTGRTAPCHLDGEIAEKVQARRTVVPSVSPDDSNSPPSPRNDSLLLVTVVGPVVSRVSPLWTFVERHQYLVPGKRLRLLP